MKVKKLLTNKDNLKKISIIILLVSFFLTYYKYNIEDEKFDFQYELINTKDMAMVEVSEKKETTTSAKSMSVFQIFKEMQTGTYEPKETPIAVELPAKENTVATLEVPKRIWYLPTEMGTITTYPSASHFALDITSPRGASEAIYPIANGVISGIYRDYAGANIVTVTHNIDGKVYTSQYVHLSKYAPNLYVGKPVTINDYLGFMGRTGIATGVHLHLAVVDCSIFDANDANCRDLNGFFRYGRTRYYQGFRGLQSIIDVPSSWTNR